MIGLTEQEKSALLRLVRDVELQQEGHNEDMGILNAPQSLLDKLKEEAQS